MDSRKKIIISILILILIAVLAAGFWWWRSNRSAETEPVPTETTGQPSQETLDQAASLPAPSEERMAADQKYPLDVKQLAFSFAERYGSYSSQGGFKNLEDLKSLMTEKMAAKINNFTLDTRVSGDKYEGYDTRALTGEFLEFSDSAAKISVGTQRFHYIENALDPEMFYQNITVYLVKIGGEWKVDDAYWEQ